MCVRVVRTGGGHFSPIGGYHEPSDSALVLDVARFKYPPYWVHLPALWEAAVEKEFGSDPKLKRWAAHGGRFS